jgi:hypothetical protein
MQRFAFGMFVALAACWTIGIASAQAADCGAPPCCAQARTVMKTCQEVVYEEQQQTFYKTVYEDVVETKMVPCVKYVEDIEYRCVPCTMMQPKPPSSCAPVNPCGPCAAESLAPVTVCRKVPVKVYRPVDAEQPVPHKTVVAKQVPYTVTVCIPKIVTKQVPVECCP